MGNFSISLGEEIQLDDGIYLVGKIVLGDFSEDFHASLSYWKRSDYERQWADALKCLINGCDKAALITSMYDPAEANFIFWWPMYSEGGKVFVQNSILFMEDMTEPFNEKQICDYVPDRVCVNEEGYRISEWVLELNDLQVFLNGEALN